MYGNRRIKERLSRHVPGEEANHQYVTTASSTVDESFTRSQCKSCNVKRLSQLERK